MKLLKQGEFEIKKSKFNSYLYEINSEIDYKNCILEIKKNHKKANHIAHAYIFDTDIKMTNDGEVGSPGRILLSYLQRNNLNKHCVIVARKFGGIKLGVGGVSRAFRKAINDLK